MAECSIAFPAGVLTVAGAVLGLPTIGVYRELHEATAARTAGLIDARCIVPIDTTIESPLGQIAMIQRLVCAPDALRATFFAVMAWFKNLALSRGQLGAKYLNRASWSPEKWVHRTPIRTAEKRETARDNDDCRGDDCRGMTAGESIV